MTSLIADLATLLTLLVSAGIIGRWVLNIERRLDKHELECGYRHKEIKRQFKSIKKRIARA